MSRTPASEFATALLGELVRRGVRDLVLSPGSRSQALALAAAAFERAGMLRLRVRIDERSAGFLALGLAVETRRPVAVVTTSGTAVAELHPAVLEAAHSGVPLVLLTADRPAELIGIGANQATVQPGIFGGAARVVEVAAPVEGADHGADAVRVAGEILDGIAGPVQANLAFREPLSAPVDVPEVTAGDWTAPESSGAEQLHPEPGTVVIAGSNAGPEAEAAARALGAPLLAEVASGARFGPNLVPAYRELLRDPAFGGEVRRAVVFGHPTLSREVPALIERAEVETIVVRSMRRLYTPVLRWSLRNREITVAIGLIFLVVSGFLGSRLGSEFLPTLEEGNLWIRASMPPTLSLEAGMPLVSRMREILLRHPEVITVVSQHGRPDNGSDAAGFFNAEFFVPLKPFEEWPSGLTKEKLVEQLQAEFSSEFVGISFNFSQYIQDNVEEGLSGVKGANSIKIVGPDLVTLEKLAKAAMAELTQVPGITDLGTFWVLGQPNL
ncbi:MAG TPA: 2-succinyl-5-enolpyruvyl-6-hydroxy-3-cyclohexene-1-carboxylic-acid synthase, partial [Pseudolysinimonas sp.]|nr:2-succinyl-5-enolpyruvyl-6-hydroxy-3-cyclohexene-1-carboxylic-acid synthase [Pseudolysinimonas sp.]